MKAIWYVIDQWGYVHGSFNSKGEAEDYLYSQYDTYFRKISLEEHKNNYTIVAQIVKEGE